MPTARDQGFADAVVGAGIVARNAVDDCLADMQRAESIGAIVSLDAVLVRKGLISRQKADELLENMSRANMPKRLGGFELIEPVGRGGTHTVYKARQLSMDRLVALKILSPRLATNKPYIERLFKEARAVAKLSHVNIIQGIDVGEDSGYFYFAAEFVEGETLGTRLAREGKLVEPEALAITEQVCLALSHFHTAANMVHGDIKPGNIIITKNGVAKVADLGLARSIGEVEGVAAGTPQYVSPEQARGGAIDIRSDIYSLGATLFHMVTGAPPFSGSSASEILAKHLNQPVPPLKGCNPMLSDGINALVQKMMAKNPRERHQSPDELLQELIALRSSLVSRGPAVKQTAPSIFRTEALASAAGAPPSPPKTLPPSRPPGKAPVPRDRPQLTAVPAPTKSKAPAFLFGALMVVAAAIVTITLVKRMAGDDKQPGTTGTPGTTTTTTVPPANPGGKSDEDAAGEALAAAQAFELQADLPPDDAAAKYDLVARRWPETKAGKAAAWKAKAIIDARDEEAKSLLEKLRKEIEEPLKEEKYAEAIRILGRFPQDLLVGQWKQAVTGEIDGLKRKAKDRANELMKLADARAKKNEFDEAIKLLQPGLKFGFDDFTKKIEEKTRGYEKVRKEHEEAVLRDAEEKLRGVLGVIIRHEEARRYDLALEECQRYVDANPGGASLKQVAELRAEIEAARDVWKSAVDALRNGIGKPMELRVGGILLKGKLATVDDESLTVDVDGRSMGGKLDDIAPETALALAGVTGDDRETLLRKARFYLASGAGATAIETVDKLGDAALLAEWRRSADRRQAVLAVSARESKAEEALREIRNAAERKDWKAAYIAIRRSRPLHAGTAAFTNASAELDGLKSSAEEGLRKELGAEKLPAKEFGSLLATLREFLSWQDENKCPKTVPCKVCGGKGYLTEQDTCPRCRGAGSLRCPTCNGRGTIRLLDILRRCSTCNGAGRVRCPMCNGTGTAKRKINCNGCFGEKTTRCPVCGGSGFKKPVPLEFRRAEDKMKEHGLTWETLTPLLKDAP